VTYEVTLIPGDGIGPEIAAAACEVLEATGLAFAWDEQSAGEATLVSEGSPLPERVIESIRRTHIALKGPITTPVGGGFRSVNVALRQALALYANVRPARSIPGVPSRYEGIDLVIVRENTEDLYAGNERMVSEDEAESIKTITRAASERIARYAFEYAVLNHRSTVTAVHKANIMKLTDGLFLDSCRKIAAPYEGRIVFQDRIVDNMCMQLVQKPEAYDVLVAPNLYGDIISDLAAGLVGGLGIAPGANIGEDAAVFEAEDALVGKGHAVGVAAQVLEHLLRAGEGAFGVHDPVRLAELGEPRREGPGVSEGGGRSGEDERPGVERAPERVEVFATEDLGEGADGEEKTGRRGKPARAVGGEGAPRDDTVQVQVLRQILPPSVQDGRDPEVAAEMARDEAARHELGQHACDHEADQYVERPFVENGGELGGEADKEVDHTAPCGCYEVRKDSKRAARPQLRVKPPLTLMACPVIHEASSDKRKVIIGAMSSGWPRRPRG